MRFRAEHFKKNQGKTDQKRRGLIFLLLPLSVSLGHAESSPHYFANLKNGLGQLIAPKPHDPRIPLISRRWVIMH